MFSSCKICQKVMNTFFTGIKVKRLTTCHTFRTVLKFNQKSVETETKSVPIIRIHVYMTASFSWHGM